MHTGITPEEVGNFIDKVVDDVETIRGTPIRRRTTSDVAGRFLEEVVELSLAAGLVPEEIMSHVMDSIHNQVGKAGRRAGRVIYPSEYAEDATQAELAEEVADCSLLLKDLSFIAGVNIPEEEERKWAAFTKRKFNVSRRGTLYAIK